MAADGSFPHELERTKAFEYSIFNLDVVAALAVELTSTDNNYLTYATPDSRSLGREVGFLFPYLQGKSRWSRPRDVMYRADWSIRQPMLLFGALASGCSEWLELWKRLPADFEVEEIRRNFPVRYPTLWLRHLKAESSRSETAL